VLQPLTEALKAGEENPYHGRKRDMKLRPAAPITAQSNLDRRFISNFAIEVPLLQSVLTTLLTT